MYINDMKCNYWSNYDSESEGCFNVNNDLFCDSPYNISGPAGSKDYFPFVIPSGWQISLKITDLIPIQVIKDVDMVKGKRTLIRVPVLFTSNESNSIINASLNLTWGGNLVNKTTENLTAGQLFNWDNWYIPNVAGSNIEVKAEVNGTHQGFNLTDSRVKVVNVTGTRNLTIGFVPADNPVNFSNVVKNSVEFINRTYPLSDNGVSSINNAPINIFITPGTANISALVIPQLLLQIRIATSLGQNQFPERSVGILPNNWFRNNAGSNNTVGVSLGLGAYKWPAIAVQEQFFSQALQSNQNFRHGVAHELGHTYGLCDEYNETLWKSQDTFLSIPGFCPNGDSNPNDGNLDQECFNITNTTRGCTTFTEQGISPWNSSSGPFYNFMGNARGQDVRWITNDSFNHLLKGFSHSSPQTASQRVLVSGFYNKSNRTANFCFVAQFSVTFL